MDDSRNSSRRSLGEADFSNRPAPVRSTPERKQVSRDLIFLLTFVAMLVGMGFLADFSIRKGDIQRYINGVDSWGNVCGREDNTALAGVVDSGKDQSGRQFVLHLALDINTLISMIGVFPQKSSSASLCVKKCPTSATNCGQLLADNGYNLAKNVVDRRVCTMPQDIILPHHPVLRFCIPSQLLKVCGAENRHFFLTGYEGSNMRM